MKRGKVLMTVLAVMAVLFASCASHLGEDENAAASKAVKINFAMIVDEEAAQKAVALNGGVNDFKFFYMADAQWDSDDPIQGDTGGNYVEINSDLAHMTDPEHRVSIGYFKPGLWKFDVVITSSDGTPETAKNLSKVIYRASDGWKNTTYSLFDSTGNRTVNIDPVPMELYTAGSLKATVIIKLAVPAIKISDPAGEPPSQVVTAPDVTVTISGGDSAASEATVQQDNEHPPVANKKTGLTYDADPVVANNWYYFTKTISNFIPGNYDFVLKYYDKDHTAGGNQVGGAIISTTILPTTYTIWGTIENGEYQIGTVTLDVDVPFTFDFSTKVGEVATTEVKTEGTMICTPNPLKNAGIDYTKWYVNGAYQGTGDGDGIFTFTTSNPGAYEIVCRADKGTAVAYSYHNVTVTPPPAISVTAPSRTIANSGELTFTAASTPAASTLQWYVKKDGVEVPQTGATSNTFTFNTSSTTYTTATQGEYEIILKATSNAAGGGLTGYGSEIVTVLAP